MVDLKPGPDQIVIANELLSGRVVFLSADGGWVPEASAAAYARNAAEAEALLAQAREAAHANLIVEPTLIAATLADGKPFPVRNREVIRATGPTMHRDHGYQAGN
ncbi:MAG: DUF2849 domain-containing protein [Rhodothalassiaceae bacterium]